MLHFFVDVLESSLNAKSDTVGTYFKLVNAHQNRGQSWEDSRFGNDMDNPSESVNTGIVSKKLLI